MTKALTIFGMIVSLLILVVFALDMSPLRIPFDRANFLMDLTMVICAVCLGYLSWSAFRDLD